MDEDYSDTGKKESKPGRAAFVPSDEQRATVLEMAAERAGHPEIARKIGVSVPTLRKAFGHELKQRLGSQNLFSAAGAEQLEEQPAPPKIKRPGAGGRNKLQVTERDRDKVSVLVASGMPMADIAKVMAMTEPTLRRHFKDELATAALRKRAEMLVSLHRTAHKGNVAAQKEALAIMDRASLEQLQHQVRSKGKADTLPIAETPGKKVQADIDAHNVVTRGPWADLVRVPPRAS